MQIDWLECTFKGIPSVTLAKLTRYFANWEELDSGGMGYDRSALVWEKGRVFWSSVRPEMGVHVRLPASAFKITGRDPQEVLIDLVEMGHVRFTRVDLAADDTTGQLEMDTIRDKVLSDEYVSRAHRVNEIRALVGMGHTVYFGSRQSETFARIYDKAAEQRSAGKAFIGHWIRVELELKGDRAHATAECIAAHPDAWREMARGWFLAFLDFKEPSSDTNKSRWTTCSWWSAFLEHASKVRLFIERMVHTVEDVKNWVEKQVTPSLFLLTQTIGRENLARMVDDASNRLSTKQEDLIASYREMLRAMAPVRGTAS